jgi:hypothetical protein
MSSFLKALIVVIIGIIVLIVIAGTIMYFWWEKNKQDLLEAAEAVRQEGIDFGKTTDNQGCLIEAVSRQKQKPGFKKTIAINMFLQICLEHSRPTPGFCDNVPKVDEIVKTTKWTLEQCKQVGLSSDSSCSQLFQKVQWYCEELRQQQSEDEKQNE